jgi:hypothetical protein
VRRKRTLIEKIQLYLKSMLGDARDVKRDGDSKTFFLRFEKITVCGKYAGRHEELGVKESTGIYSIGRRWSRFCRLTEPDRWF